jgi:hypothetical protein
LAGEADEQLRCHELLDPALMCLKPREREIIGGCFSA